MKSTYILAGTASSHLSTRAQFKDLVEELGLLGFTALPDFPSRYYISVNHNPRMYRRFIKHGGRPDNSVLIMLEPQAVYPSQYSKRVQKKYSLVLAPGKLSCLSGLCDFIPWPYSVHSNPAMPTEEFFSLRSVVKANLENGLFEVTNWSSRDNFLVMINANKVSPIKEENYTLRRKYARGVDASYLCVFGDLWNSSIISKLIHRIAVTFFALKSGKLPNLFHVYGQLHWRYKSSKGKIQDKSQTLRNSKFSLVIENDENYISEKIFDSLINGCIPVYHGPKDINKIIGDGLFLPLPLSPRDLILNLESMSEEQIGRYLENMKDFVTSEDFLNIWEKNIVYSRIANLIRENIGDVSE